MAKTSKTPPAAQETDLAAPRSDTPENVTDQQLNPDLTDVPENIASPKRGRGRPPKSKSDSHQDGGVSAQPTKKPSGRAKRNGTPAVPITSVAAAVKSRDRAKRSNPLPSQVTTTVDGSRKRGRPKKDDVATVTVPVSAVAPTKQRGRRSTTEEVAAKSVGSSKKGSSVATELKNKSALLKRKVKEAADKLKKAVTAIEEVQVIVNGM